MNAKYVLTAGNVIIVITKRFTMKKKTAGIGVALMAD